MPRRRSCLRPPREFQRAVLWGTCEEAFMSKVEIKPDRAVRREAEDVAQAPKSEKSNEDTMDHTNCRFLRPARRAQSYLGVALLFSAWACGSNSGSPTTNASSGDGSGRGGSGSDGGSSASNSGASNSGDGGGAGGSGTSGSGAAGQTSSGAGSDAAGAPDGSQTSGGGGCTRDALTAAINAYYMALAAHDPTKAPLASTVKYTENGMQLQV